MLQEHLFHIYFCLKLDVRMALDWNSVKVTDQELSKTGRLVGDGMLCIDCLLWLMCSWRRQPCSRPGHARDWWCCWCECETVDHSRVKLIPLDDTEDGSDYINASYIPVSSCSVDFSSDRNICLTYIRNWKLSFIHKPKHTLEVYAY